MGLFKKRIKTAKVTVIPTLISSVVCPYCKSNLKGIYKDILTMQCWNCGKPMRLDRSEEQ